MDQQLIRSSLINMLDNAVEACIADSAGKKSTISFRVDKIDRQIQFEIRDNGGGIPADTAGKIFDMFYSSKGRKGTGLGLYITQKAIRKHGGTITVESDGTDGSCFTVRLPVK